MKESIVIRLVGDSGDGMQLVGEQLTINAAVTGHDVRTLPDFPAEIRAPAGTVSGVSGFQLAIAEQPIFTAGETLDVLVALNPAALKHSLQNLAQGGLLVINEDSFTRKDWEKAGGTEENLDNLAQYYQLIKVPVIEHTLKAVEDVDISRTQAKKAKNFYTLGLVFWLFDLDFKPCEAFIHNKFRTNPQVADANIRALKAGYNYALTLEMSRSVFMLEEVKRPQGDYRQITGVEAVALAAATLATGTEQSMLVSGYPITPASAILHESAKMKEFGVHLFQAEDEIAAICASIGASFGGELALTCTSGPGLDLKSEGLGLAISAELPLVVIDVQRAGVSTGLPTKTGQSDLNLALYGRHGEAPVPVIAATTPANCFDTIIEAFSIAIRAMTPVVVLMDAYLANAAEPWKIPNVDEICLPSIEKNHHEQPFHRNEFLARSWNIPGTAGFIHQLGGLEKEGESGQVSYDPENHQHMVKLRAEKIEKVAEQYPQLEIEGDISAKTLVVAWGSTYGSVKAAVKRCAKEGVQIAHVHLRHLNPLPLDLDGLLKKYSKVVVAELNTGQLCDVLRAKYLVDAQLISQCNGLPFSEQYLVEQIKIAAGASQQVNQ